MTVPFEGGTTPPISPEMQTADSVVEHYRTMITEKLGDNWTSKRPNGTRIAELGYMVYSYPYIEAPVTIYDNGEDQTRPALEIDVPDGIKEIESGVVQVGRDGVFTKQSIDMVTKKPTSKELTESDVAVLTSLFSRNTLWPRSASARSISGLDAASWNQYSAPRGYGISQWDAPRLYERPAHPHMPKSELRTSIAGQIKRMFEDLRSSEIRDPQDPTQDFGAPANAPESAEGINSGMHLGTDPYKRSYTFKGFGDDRLINQELITKLHNTPLKSAPEHPRTLDSDHFPVDSGFGRFAEGETPVPDAIPTDKYKIINESIILFDDPNFREKRERQHSTDDPGIPVWQVATDDAVNVYISDGMFHITKKAVADSDEQKPEDK